MTKALETGYGGLPPPEVLFEAVTKIPQQLRFHIERFLSIVHGNMSGDFANCFFHEETGVSFRCVGGEVLTRCPNHLSGNHIGEAFNEMPSEMMEEMFPILLKKQLNFVRAQNRTDGVRYSINLEGMQHGSRAWNEVCALLLKNKDLPIVLEIKENSQLSVELISDIEYLCGKTSNPLYLDDFCTSYHCVWAWESYISLLIEVLHRWIRGVKIGYGVIKSAVSDKWGYVRLQKSLENLLGIWKTYTQEMPCIVFEYLPRSVEEIRQLEKLAQPFRGSVFQN